MIENRTGAPVTALRPPEARRGPALSAPETADGFTRLGIDPGRANALAVATVLCSAPVLGADNPLSIIPSSWLPHGDSTRPYEARQGLITLQSGNANIRRDDNSISVSTRNGNFGLTPDPDRPGQVLADTPQGQFSGALTRNGNKIEFRTPDGQRRVTIERNRGYTRFDTSGFGLADYGHLRVRDR